LSFFFLSLTGDSHEIISMNCFSFQSVIEDRFFLERKKGREREKERERGREGGWVEKGKETGRSIRQRLERIYEQQEVPHNAIIQQVQEELFLELKSRPMYNGREHSGLPALHLAAAVLAMARASPTVIHSADHNGVTPLHLAAYHGHIDVARSLLDSTLAQSSSPPINQGGRRFIGSSLVTQHA